jgi:kynurenine formamidase
LNCGHSDKVEADLDYRLTVGDLLDWEARNGEIPKGAIVVMRSGNHKYYGDKKRYFGYPDGIMEKDPKDTDHMHFPGFHSDAAKWLVENRDIVGVGVDTPSTDYGQCTADAECDYDVHQILAKENIWGLENLANLDMLPEKGYVLYNMVYKLKEGSGGPSRVFAVKADESVGKS